MASGKSVFNNLGSKHAQQGCCKNVLRSAALLHKNAGSSNHTSACHIERYLNQQPGIIFPATFSLLHTAPVESLWDTIGLNRAVLTVYYYLFYDRWKVALQLPRPLVVQNKSGSFHLPFNS
jgi:hypothetical protein